MRFYRCVKGHKGRPHILQTRKLNPTSGGKALAQVRLRGSGGSSLIHVLHPFKCTDHRQHRSISEQQGEKGKVPASREHTVQRRGKRETTNKQTNKTTLAHKTEENRARKCVNREWDV